MKASGNKRELLVAALAMAVILLFLAPYPSPALGESTLSPNKRVNLILETKTRNYDSIAAEVARLGGTVRYKFRFVSAIAITIDAIKVPELEKHPDVAKIYRDEVVSLPEAPPQRFTVRADDRDRVLETVVPLRAEKASVKLATVKDLISAEPKTYYTWQSAGAADVWIPCSFGNDSIIAIIDTGIWTGHISFAHHPIYGDKVIGGVDLSPDVGTPYEGYDRQDNHWHGSHVAGIAAGWPIMLVASSDWLFFKSIELYTGKPLPEFSPGLKYIVLSGIAPLAKLYIVKVFPHTGAGVPISIVLAGIEEVIWQKARGGLDIDVLGMSLGGPTGFDAQDLESRLVDIATSRGITVVSAAGNSGPAPLTVESPGTAWSGLAVAAAAHPVTTRVFWDLYFNRLGIGRRLYVRDEIQTIYFSSRGPTSDGRRKPDIAATGVFVLSAYIEEGPYGLAFASGTSMSTPAVSGAVALLNTYVERVGMGYLSMRYAPYLYKAAIKRGAVGIPSTTNNLYGYYDHGRGYLNVAAALNQIIRHGARYLVDRGMAERRPKQVLYAPVNVEFENGAFRYRIDDLDPGHSLSFVFLVDEPRYEWRKGKIIKVSSVRISLRNVQVSANPDGEAQAMFPSSIEVYVAGGVRTWGAYYIYSENVFGDETFVIEDDTSVIVPGYWRVTIESDWTNGAPVSCELVIEVTKEEVDYAPPKFRDSIRQGELDVYLADVPAGAAEAVFELSWRYGWTYFPTNDLDLYLISSDGTYFFEGVTLNEPERVRILDPVPGTWVILVYGYNVYNRYVERGHYYYPYDIYELRVVINP